jgi:spermidine/putrescine transport system ATP-binding protein
MKKERLCNTFEGTVVDKSHVRFLDTSFQCNEAAGFTAGAKVTVSVEFGDIVLHDNEEDGMLQGDVDFILYKGNHYHLTIATDDNEHIFVDTTDVWDDEDRVGITIAPEAIHLSNI